MPITIDTYIGKKTNGCHLEKNGAKVNQLFFIGHLKLYGKNDEEIGSLIKTVWQCSEDIKMEKKNEFIFLKYLVVSLQ